MTLYGGSVSLVADVAEAYLKMGNVISGECVVCATRASCQKHTHAKHGTEYQAFDAS